MRGSSPEHGGELAAQHPAERGSDQRRTLEVEPPDRLQGYEPFMAEEHQSLQFRGRAVERRGAALRADAVGNDQPAPLYARRIPDPATNACLPAPLPGGGTASSSVLCGVQNGTIDPRTLHVVIIEAENKNVAVSR